MNKLLSAFLLGGMLSTLTLPALAADDDDNGSPTPGQTLPTPPGQPGSMPQGNDDGSQIPPAMPQGGGSSRDGNPGNDGGQGRGNGTGSGDEGSGSGSGSGSSSGSGSGN